MSLFDDTGNSREIPIYLDYEGKGIRIIFDISKTGFKPILTDFSPLEFEEDAETEKFIGCTIIKRLVDNCKRIKMGERDEVHFIMYIGSKDFKDIYGFRKRHPIFRKDVIISEIKKEDTVEYNLRRQDKEDIFSISERAYLIIQLLDGKHEISDIVKEFNKRYGSISPRSVNHFIDTLQEKGFLEPEIDIAFGKEYIEEEPKLSFPEKILSFEYSFPDVDRMVTTVYSKFRWIFSIPVATLIALSLAAFFYEIYKGFSSFHIGYVLQQNAYNPRIIYIYYGIMLFTVVTHEFAHALSCKRYGGHVNRMGVMLYYFQICAYADTSDAWLFKERYKRILTALNGPLWSLFVASMCLWCYYMVTPPIKGKTGFIHSQLWYLGNHILSIDDTFRPSIEQILIMVMIANLLVSLFNLLPFTEMDGYYILTDLINSPNIRMLSMGYVLNFFRRLLKKPPYPVYPDTALEKLGYSIYGSLCLLYAVAAIGFILYFLIIQYNIAFHSVFGIFAMVSIIFFILKTMFLKRTQQKREFLRKKVISY